MTVEEYKSQLKPVKKSKYRNIKVELNGIHFDSKKEAAQYKKYLLLKKVGEITDFQMQVRYDLAINGVKLGFYKADFVVTWKSGLVRVVDVKGIRTPVYILKRKLMLAIWGIKILEL